MLGRLRFGDELLGSVHEALHASHPDERREHEKAIARPQAEHARLGLLIGVMRLDKLDGMIGGGFFEEMSGKRCAERHRLPRSTERLEESEQSRVEVGLRILELARNAHALFERQPAREKRRLVSFVPSPCTRGDGEVDATFLRPSDHFAKTAACPASAAAGHRKKPDIR